MSNFEINFLPDDVRVMAAEGESLLDVATRGKVHINASCGGEGVCGRCLVELREGTLEASPGLYLDDEAFEKGERLACRAKINGPASIFIPLESRADSSSFRKASEANESLLVEHLSPMVSQSLLELRHPSNEDNQSDLDRVLVALGAENLPDPDIDLGAMRILPQVLRESDYKIRARIYHDLPVNDPQGPSPARIISFSPASEGEDYYALAVDVGTTSVWIRLVNLFTGECLPGTGELNRQIASGEDVISRIVYACRPGGLVRIQNQVLDTINQILERLEEDYPGYRKKTYLMTLAGNTTMSHLLLGLDPKNIRLAPYVPPTSTWPSIRARYLGINVEAHTVLKVFPSVSSYVGGDIVAGVLAAGFFESSELTLFIDVGTNGEIVIGNKDWLTCAACSAGPAFEGGGVKCGMRAAPGAIENFIFDVKTRDHRLQVVGDGLPSGICGSGLISIVAELFRNGVLDKQGAFVEKSSKWIRKGEDGWEYLLSPAEKSAGGRDVVITAIDVDNLIRAKAAMFSGYQTLVEAVGLNLESLERVIIAGGFGRSLNLSNAITIGLLPFLPLERFTYIGNSSLTGATLVALSGELWQKSFEIKRMMTNFELSETASYMGNYVASQFIPHTDRTLFGL